MWERRGPWMLERGRPLTTDSTVVGCTHGDGRGARRAARLMRSCVRRSGPGLRASVRARGALVGPAPWCVRRSGPGRQAWLAARLVRQAIWLRGAGRPSGLACCARLGDEATLRRAGSGTRPAAAQEDAARSRSISAHRRSVVAGARRTRHREVRVALVPKRARRRRVGIEHVFYRTSSCGRMRGSARQPASGGTSVRSLRGVVTRSATEATCGDVPQLGPFGPAGRIGRLGGRGRCSAR